MVDQAQPRKGGPAQVQRMIPSIPYSIRGCDAMDGVIQIIQSLGFPIACTVAMFCMWQSEVRNHHEEMEKMRTTLEDQAKATTEALQGNTVILAKILTKLGDDAV